MMTSMSAMSGANVAVDGRLVQLRRRIAILEGRGLLPGALAGGLRARDPDTPAGQSLSPRRGRPVLPFGLAPLDACLGGGLRRNALHELRGMASRNGAATGFALALLARLSRDDDRPVLWIMEAAAAREAGALYGVGLDRFGLAARQVVLVNVRTPAEALWTFEEALRCRGLAAVMAEIRGHPRLLDLTASRRLALRARDSGVMALLLRQVEQPEPGAALTRWQVVPRPTRHPELYPAGIGPPAWQVTLERNRRGATGVFDLEWDHATRTFAAIDRARAAASGPVAAAPVDRSSAPSGARTVVALRDAS